MAVLSCISYNFRKYKIYIYIYIYKIRWVVLDEVDRLLDMGFEQTILEILSTIRGVRLPGLKDREVLTV
jgi:superfamily II DNA/RNA helicase